MGAVAKTPQAGKLQSATGGDAATDRPAGTAAAVSADARKALTALRARATGDSFLPAGLADGFREAGERLVPHFPATQKASPAAVTFAKRATSPLTIVDSASGAGIDVAIVGARKVDAEIADGYVVYRNAHASGATLLHRALPEGEEDFVAFDARPRTASVSYKIALRSGAAGLRLVSGSLEILDAGGAPRLRTAFPFIVGADGARTEAVLSVEGCAVDRNPAAPWGRKVTPPGARSCTVRVSWDDAGVAYPAILDPRWTTTTTTMVALRTDHTATLLTTLTPPKVLVACGRASISSTTGLPTAELFDPATNSWAATGSLTGTTPGRWSHTATLLNPSSNSTTSGKVLVAGGINGTASLSTAQLYNPATGTWATAGNLNAPRHVHTATLLPNGNVVVIGGMNGTTTVLNTAAVYNPSSGSGSWTGVTATMASNRRSHSASLLTSANTNFGGRVLVAGGNSGSTTSLTSAQLFVPNNTTPASSTWTTTTALPTTREGHTATTLANNNVLVTGGKSVTTTLGTTLVFTIPASGTAATWVSAGTMSPVRQQHTATLLSSSILSNGPVLVAGGSDGTSPQTSALLWNGATTWTATTALPAAVQAQTATLLASGLVLVAGGNTGTTAVNTARLYDPSFALGCTSNAQCATGFCVNGVCCDTACTNQCMACNLTGSVGTCSNKTNGTTCNDSNACTTGETCQAGACGGGTAVTCTTDQCHTIGACVPATGCPAPVSKPNGTTCDDGNACTQADTCQAGSCASGTPVVCAAQDQCHVAGTCNTGTGVCSNPAKPNGTTCNDGNACTQTDTCQVGICTGANPVVCTASDQCHDAGSCNTGTGVCSNPAKPNGTACDDGNACTQGDVCNTGTCQGPTAFSCVPPDVCHGAGTCNSGSASQGPPSTQDLIGWWKLDGNGADSSGGGHDLTNEGAVPAPGRFGLGMKFDGTSSCMSAPVWTNARLQGAPGVTMMAWVNIAANYPCPSGALAVMGRGFDYSAATWCQAPGDPVITGNVVAAGDQGVGYPGGFGSLPRDTWSLVAVTWDLINVRIYLNGQFLGSYPHAGAIDDGEPTFNIGCMRTLVWNPPVGEDHFFAGTIDEAMLYARALSNAEIATYYAQSDPCTHPPLTGNACNDGNACTQTDTCQAGVCTGASPVVCAAQDQCHVAGTCDPASGTCSNPHVADGAVCSDGNRCTSGDACQAGTCLPGTTNTCTAPGQAKYATIVDLGSALGRSYATGINNSGVVVGTDGPLEAGIYQLGVPGSRGFHWSESEGVVYLPWTGTESYAVDINDAGVMSVTAGVQPWTLFPCRYDPAVDAQPVCQAAAGNAGAINASGMVSASGYFTAAGNLRMVRFDAGSSQELPSIPNVNPYYMSAVGAGIAADGTVVGTQLIGGSWTPIRYTDARGTEVLQDLLPPGSGWALTDVGAIHPGEILCGGTIGGYRRACRMTTNSNGDVTSIVQLPLPPTLAPDAPYVGRAMDSNASHEISGTVFAPDAFNAAVAFVYTDATGSIDLNTLLDPQSGWYLVGAFGINDNHEVVGFGYHGSGGQQHAYKLKLPDLSPCAATDFCHLPGVRDPLTGVCSNPTKPDGVACDDGQVCTQSETCQAGSCTAPAGTPTILNLTVDDLGGIGGTDASAQDINSRGDTVGGASTASGETHAFFRPAAGPMADVGLQHPSGAQSVNDADLVAGSVSLSDGWHAFRYSVAGGVQDLGLVGDGSISTQDPGFPTQGSYGHAINNLGEVVGDYTNSGRIGGFRYSDQAGGGLYQDIGSLAGGMTRAGGIDDDGTVVGSSWVPGSPAVNDVRRLGHAVMFHDVTVGLVDLNDLIDPALGWTLHQAIDIKGDYVVGTGELGGMVRPFRLRISSGTIEEISGGWAGLTSGNGVNRFGDVVGWGYLDAAQTEIAAYVFSDRFGFKKLNDIIDPASGWDLRFATAINDASEIVGSGVHGAQTAAFHLSVAPKAVACGGTANTCGGTTGAVCLWSDGVVDVGGGKFVAVFGFNNSAAVSVFPTTNEVRMDGTLVANPQPAPPANLMPGTHAAAFLPTFAAGHTIAWTVDGQTVSASAASTQVLSAVTASNGTLVATLPDGTTLSLDPGQGTSPSPASTTLQQALSGRVGPVSGLQAGGVIAAGLSGDAKVMDDGSASYTIPIWVPDGVHGMQPSLAIQYNSSSGAGLLGPRWGISGLSAITRCPQRLSQDGLQRPVDVANGDAFCLDGQRLVRISGSPNSSGEFRTEVNPFQKIIVTSANASGPLSFKVMQPDGTIYNYGRSASSRLSLNAGPTDFLSAFYVDKIQDRYDNSILISYRRDFDYPAGGKKVQALVPDTITWGGTGDTSGQRSITFQYRPSTSYDPDRYQSYVDGYQIVGGQRLAGLDIYGPDGIARPLLKRYRFGYNTQSITGEALLASISECDAQDVCKRPTAIQWEAGTLTYTRTDLGITDVALSNAPTLTSVCPAGGCTPTQLPASRFYRRLIAVDLDQDGRDDIVYRQYTGSGNYNGNSSVNSCMTWVGRLARPDGTYGSPFSLPVGQDADPGCPGGDYAGQSPYFPFTADIMFADLDLNGYPDLLSPRGNSGLMTSTGFPDFISMHSYYKYLNTGVGALFGTSSGKIDSNPPQPPDFRCATADTSALLAVGDFKGLGNPDLVRPSTAMSSIGEVCYAGGWNAYPDFSGLNGIGEPVGSFFSLDLDGDGTSEILRFGISSQKTQAMSATFNGWVNLPAVPSNQRWFLDLNGDGLVDVAYMDPAQPGTIKTMFGTGIDFKPGGTTALPAGSQPSVSANNGTRIADINGDGRQDLVLMDDGQVPSTVCSCNTMCGQECAGVGLQNLGQCLSLCLSHCSGNCANMPTNSRSDIVVLLSDGRGGFSAQGTGIAVGDASDGSMPADGTVHGYRTSIVLDVNGDGLPDLMQLEGGHLVSYVRQGKAPDVVTSLREGTGRSIAVEHAPATDASVYVADTESCKNVADPKRRLACFVRGGSLVKSLTISGLEAPGVSLNRTIRYTYSGGLFDRRGRGFLGFERRDIYDAASSRHTTLTYDPISFAELTPGDSIYIHPFALKASTIVVDTDTPQGPNSHHQETESFNYSVDAQVNNSRFTVLLHGITRKSVDCPSDGSGSCPATARVLAWSDDTYSFDPVLNYNALGKPTNHVTTYRDPAGDPVRTDSTTTQYAAFDAVNWLMSAVQVQSGSTSLTASSSETVTRTIKITPDPVPNPTTGVLTGDAAMIEFEPSGDASVRRRESFGRDTRGRLRVVHDGVDWPTDGAACSGSCNASCEQTCTGLGPGTGPCVGGCMGSCVPTCMDTPTQVRTTSYTYDDSDSDGVYVRSVTDSGQLEHRAWRHPGFGLVVETDDPNLLPSVKSYDTFGRLLSETASSGASVTYAYDDSSDPVAIGGMNLTVIPEGKASRQQQIHLDSFGRPTSTTSPVDATRIVVHTSVYDLLGRLTQSTVETGPVSGPSTVQNTFIYTYDDLDRPLSDCHLSSDDVSVCAYLAYDGRATTATDESGRVRTVVTDQFGHPVSQRAVVEAGTSEATFTYGAFGLLERETASDGTGETDIGYDVLGRPNLVTRTGAGTRGTGYNAFGDSTGVYKVGSDGTTKVEEMILGRDALGRLTSLTGSGMNRTYSWDAPASAPAYPAPFGKGKLVDVTDTLTTGTVTRVHYDYGFNGLVFRKTWSGNTWAPFSASATYTYDTQGRLDTRTYPKVEAWSNPLVVSFAYDPFTGDVSSITDALQPMTPIWNVTSRDDRGRITGEAMRVPSSQDIVRGTSYYPATGFLKTVRLDNAGGSGPSYADLTYRYDSGGLPSGSQQSGTGITGEWSSTFAYDNLGRLKRWGPGQCCNGYDVGVDYSYDDSDNLTSRRWSSSSVAGNLLYGTTATTGGAYTRTVTSNRLGAPSYVDSYRADPWGRIFDTPAVGLTYNAVDEVSAVGEKANGQTDYVFRDGFGARVATTYGNPFNGQPWSQLLTFDDLVEIRTSNTGTEERCRLRANGRLIGELVRTSDTPTRSATFYATDAAGSVFAESNATAVTTRARRDPFGNLVPDSQMPEIPPDPAAANQDGSGRLGFGDHPREENWGLVDMNARFYSPRLGRFISPDSMIINALDRRDYNPFAYVRNNPVSVSDPTGHGQDHDHQPEATITSSSPPPSDGPGGPGWPDPPPSSPTPAPPNGSPMPPSAPAPSPGGSTVTVDYEPNPGPRGQVFGVSLDTFGSPTAVPQGPAVLPTGGTNLTPTATRGENESNLLERLGTLHDWVDLGGYGTLALDPRISHFIMAGNEFRVLNVGPYMFGEESAIWKWLPAPKILPADLMAAKEVNPLKELSEKVLGPFLTGYHGAQLVDMLSQGRTDDAWMSLSHIVGDWALGWDLVGDHLDLELPVIDFGSSAFDNSLTTSPWRRDELGAGSLQFERGEQPGASNSVGSLGQ